jgi:two-component system, OmpR family, response regulator VicR
VRGYVISAIVILMKVLIIDDDKFLCTMLESALRQENYDVAVTHDGDDGVTKLLSWKPDAIILDIILPKKDGFEVLDTIKNSSQTKNIPVFIFSSLSQEQEKKEMVRLGARGYFSKGTETVHHLVEAINKLRGSS